MGFLERISQKGTKATMGGMSEEKQIKLLASFKGIVPDSFVQAQVLQNIDKQIAKLKSQGPVTIEDILKPMSPKFFECLEGYGMSEKFIREHIEAML